MRDNIFHRSSLYECLTTRVVRHDVASTTSDISAVERAGEHATLEEADIYSVTYIRHRSKSHGTNTKTISIYKNSEHTIKEDPNLYALTYAIASNMIFNESS